jgi:hypothetical protein
MDFLKKIGRGLWQFLLAWGQHRAKLARSRYYLY